MKHKLDCEFEPVCGAVMTAKNVLTIILSAYELYAATGKVLRFRHLLELKLLTITSRIGPKFQQSN